MPPFKYFIRLTNSEKGALRQLRRAKTEVRLADRARILLWAHEGVTIDETARRLECGHEKVILWRRRFLEGRAAKLPVLERLRDQPRSGRPASFSPAGPRDGGLGDLGTVSSGTANAGDHGVQ
jgi:hypothetical protein